MDVYRCQGSSLYAFVLPFNINTPASGQRSGFLSPRCVRSENRYPFSPCLCLPHLSSLPDPYHMHHTVLANPPVCLRQSGGSLTDPHFRLCSSSLCSALGALGQPCTWTTNVDGEQGKKLEKGGSGDQAAVLWMQCVLRAVTSGLL